jgi:glycosyltransferase involved in cell wall biosynthesis
VVDSTAIVTDMKCVSFFEVSKDVASALQKKQVPIKIYNINAAKIPEKNIIFVGNIFHLPISYLQRFLPEHNVIFYAITEGIPILDYNSVQLCSHITLITPSLYTKSCLEQGGLRVEEVIPHGVNLQARTDLPFRDYLRENLPNAVRQKTHNIILNISGNVQRKALDKQLIAFKTVEHVIRDSYLILHTGLGDFNIVAFENSLELKRYWMTNLWGNLPKEKIHALYELCDFYCQPSYVEGFGLTYLEAFLHGKPVIGVDCSGVSEIVKDGVTGILLKPTKTEDIIWQQRHAIRLYHYDLDDLIKAMVLMSDEKTRNGMQVHIKEELPSWDMNLIYPKFLELLK